jgi:hypothetical protein
MDHSCAMDNFKTIECNEDTVVEICDKNSGFLNTIDGIQNASIRLSTFVFECLIKYRDIRKISFIGHSYGGLIIKECLIILQSKMVFRDIVPFCYISISTPHYGIKLNYIFSIFSQITSTTQYISSLTHNEDDKIFSIFEKVILYGNLIGDYVSLESACMLNKTHMFNGKYLIEQIDDSQLYIMIINDKNILRKAAKLKNTFSSHKGIIARHSFLPFLRLKDDEESNIVINDIVKELK